MYCRNISLRLIIMYLSGIIQSSKYIKTVGVLRGVVRPFWRSIASICDSWSMSCVVTPYHASELVNMLLISIEFLKHFSTSYLYGPKTLSFRILQICLTIPIPFPRLAAMFLILFPVFPQIMSPKYLSDSHFSITDCPSSESTKSRKPH